MEKTEKEKVEKMEKKVFYTVRGYQLLDQHQNNLTASLEDYLEMICRNIITNGRVRVKDLAKELHVRPSSVSKMIRRLADLHFLDYEKYGSIRLTEQGEAIGKYLLWRHDTLHHFFIMVNGPGGADSFVEAELAEHILSRKTVESLGELIEFFEEYPEIYQKFREQLPEK